MKKLIFIFAGLILSSFNLNATTSVTHKENTDISIYNRGYSNAFIFVENGIEFSVFRDGQFDFNLLRNNSRLNVSIGTPNVNISFNSGYDYDAYIQYDEYGAIIQIENTPVFYDYYGRVSQVGNVNINYNNYGYITRVGGLYVHYNNYNVFSHCTGFINVFNRNYVYRPWHRYYRAPAYDYCVVYNRPYRQHYRPVRYTYVRPFYNNHRPRTAIASRRGDYISRNRNYATVNRSSRNITQVNRKASERRYVVDNNTKRYNSNSNDVRRSSDNNRKVISNNRTNNTVINRSTPNRSEVQNNNTRNNEIKRYKENNRFQKPNDNNNRTYSRSNTNTRYTAQVNQRPAERESRPTITRSSQSNQMATKTRGNSGNNIKSDNSNRRR